MPRYIQLTDEIKSYMITQYGFNFDTMPNHRVFALTTTQVGEETMFIVDVDQGVDGEITDTGGYRDNIDSRSTLELMIESIAKEMLEYISTSALVDDLSDVIISNIKDDDILIYEATTENWNNIQLSAYSDKVYDELEDRIRELARTTSIESETVYSKIDDNIYFEDSNGVEQFVGGSDGWSGTFTNGDGDTVTVVNGIITDVS